MMAEEQTKTQVLLAILQTRVWTKTERTSARQEINRYYERKLASLQHALFEAIALNTPEQRNLFEMDEYIHRYHKQAQELYVYINARSFSNEMLPQWLQMIDEDDRGIAVWQPKTRLLASRGAERLNMVSQGHDSLWEHLQGKSREELLGLLEYIMQKQPEIKGLLKLLLELPLTSGARAEHKAGVGRVRTLEPATIQAQVRAAFAQAGHAWGYSMLAATDLYRVLDIGDRFTEAGQWANAQVVYATVAEEILPSYEELEEEDHLAGVLEGCLGGLLSCLEAQPELSVEEQLEEADRQALLASLFALWKHGCKYGMKVDEIPQALAQQATRDEQALMVQWVRQEKALDKAAGNTWLNRHLDDFLALLTAQ